MLYKPRNQLLTAWLLIIFMLSAPCFASDDSSPKRIVSLGPINTENVFLLGAGDRLVGDTIYCIRPAGAVKKPKIGSVMQVSIEKIIALQPDIILATALTRAEQVQQLKSLGFKVIRFTQPRSFDEICSQFVVLGKLLGREKQAENVVRQAREKVKEIRDLTTNLSAKKVFLQVGAQPLFGAVPGSFINDFIALNGGENIIAEQRQGTSKLEKIISRNPDIIIIAIMGSESGIAGVEKKKWFKYPIINAVRDNRIFIINPDLVCSPSPETFTKALSIIAKMIHPELEE